jgi:hypothetical protein
MYAPSVLRLARIAPCGLRLIRRLRAIETGRRNARIARLTHLVLAEGVIVPLVVLVRVVLELVVARVAGLDNVLPLGLHIGVRGAIGGPVGLAGRLSAGRGRTGARVDEGVARAARVAGRVEARRSAARRL